MLIFYIDLEDRCSVKILSIYIPWPFLPVWGVADNTKETKKNNGGFTPFFQQWRGIQCVKYAPATWGLIKLDVIVSM